MTNDVFPQRAQRSRIARQDAASRHPRPMKLVALASAAVVVALLGAGAAHAQRKKITLDDLVIEGNIQKPEAFFILPRTNLNFADLERREDLKARIVEAVELQPF